MKKTIKYIYALAYILLLSVMSSCAEGTDAEQRSDGENRMVFAMTRSNQDIVNHTTVYQFDTWWQYMKKIQGVTYGTDDLSMRMDAGTWNLALVTGEDLNPTSVISPVNGEGRAGKMWQTQAVEGVLPSMPELRTAYIEDQVIIPNITNYASTSMHRNVAMVRVYIEKTRGLDPTGTHTLYINGVPTTLNWAGELYPNKHTPDVSTSPLKGTFSIHNKVGDAGFQESSVLEFIIPAHKGNDYLSPSPQDTTTHKLNLGVDLACAGGTRFTKNGVEISHAPRANSILEVRLSMVGELEVSAHILDWNEVEVNAALDYTELMVSKAKVELAYKDTIYVNTNAANFTVTPASGVLWMSAARIGTTNAVEITAEVSFYSSPRSSYFSVTANNLVKNIPVTQRPEKGTISATESFWVSPSSGNATRAITVSSKGPWVLITPTPATVTPNITSGGAGDTNIVFTRKAHTGVVTDYSPYYGNSVFTVKNTETLETVTVTADNLYLAAPEHVNVNAAGGISIIDDIVVIGGVGTYSIESIDYNSTGSGWITSAMVVDGNLELAVLPGDEEHARNCTITIRHDGDHAYTQTITIEQNYHIIQFAPFDYMLIRVIWPSTLGLILDIQVDLSDTGVAGLDRLPVGWAGATIIKSSQSYKGYTFLEWPGDSQQNGIMAAYANLRNLCSTTIYNELPRYFKVNVYATWYTATSNVDVSVQIIQFEGGTMQKTNVGGNYDYVNTGGTETYNDIIPGFAVPTLGGYANYTQSCTLLGTVTYDKLTRKATFEALALRPSGAQGRVTGLYTNPTPMLPGETREQYAKRLENLSATTE